MRDQLDSRELYPLIEAIRLYTGIKVRRETAWRWATGKNKHGMLMTYKVGKRRMCSLDDVEDFITRSNSMPCTEETPSAVSPSRRKRQVEEAKKRLDELLRREKKPKRKP